MVSHLLMQKIWITGFFFDTRLHWQFEVEKKILQMCWHIDLLNEVKVRFLFHCWSTFPCSQVTNLFNRSSHIGSHSSCHSIQAIAKFNAWRALLCQGLFIIVIFLVFPHLYCSQFHHRSWCDSQGRHDHSLSSHSHL